MTWSLPLRCQQGRLEKLGYLHCANGMTGEGVHIFLATLLTAGAPDREQTEQDVQQQWFPATRSKTC